MPVGGAQFFVHIVDDDASVRRALSRLLRAAGVDNRAYESPEGFLAAVSDIGPACLVLDITMPGINGFELVARLRARGMALPVIAVSARDDEETRQLARDLGVSLFLRKPVDDQALLDAMAWVVGGVFAGERPAPAAAPLR